MVFDRPQQITAARASVDCFFAQTWPCKELVIFNATAHRLLPWWSRRRALEIRLKPRLPHRMLALCMENSNGEWCANWLPDCWYDPGYLAAHMKHRDKQRLVVFRQKQVFSLTNRKFVVVTGHAVQSWSFYRHCPVDLEGKPLAEQFTDILEVDNPANLIIKFASEIV
jgi:hypothetical protein